MVGRAVAAPIAPEVVSALTTAPYAKELRNACDAVRLASRLCKEVQQQLTHHEKVDKQDDSPVTVADYGAQVLVAWSLSRADPSTRLSMVAEEDSNSLRSPADRPMLERITQLVNSVIATVDPTADVLSPEDALSLIDLGNSAGGPSGRHWVLDPIDGTRGFVGMRQYAVCLGLLQDGEVVLGVLGCPNLPQTQVTDDDGGAGAVDNANRDGVGALFLAHRGHGAFAAPLWVEQPPTSSTTSAASTTPVQRINVDDVQAPFTGARFMESFESKHSNRGFTAAVADIVGVTKPPLRMDSQVKYGILSRGDASIFMRFPPAAYREKIWDHAAGFVIVEEAGGKVTDAKGRRLDFSQGRYLELQLGIVAAPPAVHAAIIAAVEQVGPNFQL